jgi:GNAT superfamily N-acetyltransferase
MIKIVPFTSEHAKAFKELNTAWLEKYFFVEAKDTSLLENSKENIVDKGGYIFMALYDSTPVGCFSFIPLSKNTYELGKMAVSDDYQGKKIGQHLMNFAIDFAKQYNWDKIVLYSSTKLPTALYIYRKYGFVEVDLENDLPYTRSDIKMELTLK